MATSDKELFEAAASAARAEVQGIRGCEIVSTEHLHIAFRHYLSHLVVMLDGWSPTLHAIRMRASLPRPFGLSCCVEDARVVFSELAHVQADRAARGRALGIDLPMRFSADPDFGNSKSNVTCSEAVEIGHLRIDRALLKRMARHGTAAALRRIRRLMIKSHSLIRHVGYDLDTLSCVALPSDLFFVDDATGTPVVSLFVPVTEGVELFGSQLVIEDHWLPETVLAALSGRPLSDAVAIAAAPDLAERTIERVHHNADNNHLIIDLVPDLVVIGELGRGASTH